MTDRLRAAAKAALEALEWAWGGEPLSSKEHEAMQLLRAALAEPEVEQEPVAWQYVWSPGMCFTTDSMATLHNYVQGAEDRLPPEKRGYVRALYTAPPRREWVPLTDEEIAVIASTPCAVVGSYVHVFARAIEAELKERNA